METSNERSWPVGQLRPNGFGLFDMHGNVSEWCQDWHQSCGRAGLQQDDGATALGEGSYRVIRGGAYATENPDSCLSNGAKVTVRLGHVRT